MDPQNVFIALGLTLFAGLSTGIGSAIAFFARKTSTRLLSVALGFSAGVMIYISLTEIVFKAKNSITPQMSEQAASGITVAAFFGGIALIAVIDALVPSYENPHEMHRIEEMNTARESPPPEKLLRMGVLTAIAIGIHNFPEGLATFVSSLRDPTLGVPIAAAIAIHNIPEGIAVSVPVFFATGSRKKAFMYSFLSGIAEPAGALLGWFLLMPLMNDIVFGMLFASVAGIMVFISFDELLPTAERYGRHHHAIYGLIAGMAVMCVSLLLFL